MVLCKLSSAILSSLNSHFLNLEASSPILLLLRPEINHGKPSYFLPVQAFGGGGVFLRDRGVKGPRWGEGRKWTAARARGPLTTGLARAELPLEELRELDLKWPLCSEGCPPSWPRDTQMETKEQVSEDARRTEATRQRLRLAVRPARCSPEGKERLVRPLASPGKGGCVFPAFDMWPLRTQNLITLSKNTEFLVSRKKVTQSICSAGVWRTPSFCAEKPPRCGRDRS